MISQFSEQDLDRAFGHVYYHKDDILSIASRIFSQNQPGKLAQLSDERLERLIVKMSESEDVRALRHLISDSTAISAGTLQNIPIILYVHLQKLKIIPSDRKKIYDRRYQDLDILCATDDIVIGHAMMHAGMSLEEISQKLTPENVYYSDLARLFPNGKLSCPRHGSDSRLRKIADLFVYRDSASDEQLSKKAISVIRESGNRYFGNRFRSKNIRYANAESYVVSQLYHLFKSVKKNDKVAYTKIYKIFEWLMRENFDPDQFFPHDPYMRKILVEVVRECDYVTLPYAVIMTRIKGSQSALLKTVRALYNVRTEEERNKGKDKKYSDQIGGRVVTRTTEEVYALAHSVGDIMGWEVVNVEDYIKDKKGNGYKSHHSTIKANGVEFDLQIRTHEQDRKANRDPAQSHKNYKNELQELLKHHVPPQVIKFISDITGIGSPELMPYLK